MSLKSSDFSLQGRAPLERSFTDDKQEIASDGHHESADIGLTPLPNQTFKDAQFDEEQLAGVTKIEALCTRFSNSLLLVLAELIYPCKSFLDLVFGKGWKLWLLYLCVQTAAFLLFSFHLRF